MENYISAIIAALASIVAALLAFRGTKGATTKDSLTEAAELYGNYAKRMEDRLLSVEGENQSLKKDLASITSRLNEAEGRAEDYLAETKQYRRIITDVIRDITELLEWEIGDQKSVPPSFTLAMVLNKLTSFMDDREDSSKAEMLE